MADARIKWNPNALYDIRRNPALVAAEEQFARRIADAASAQGGGTYAVGSQQGEKRPQGRWRVSVVTADERAIRENASNNTILRALGSIS